MSTSQKYNSVVLGANASDELTKLLIQQQDDTAVSARFVESSERFSKWIDRMLEYGFTNGVDYTPYQKVHPLNKQSFGDYALTLDTAKEVAMIQRNEKGRQARRFFIECEKALREFVQRSVADPRISGLVELINSLTDKVISLEAKIDQIGKSQTQYFKTQKFNDQTTDLIETRIKREKILTFVTTTIHRSHTASWTTFWDRFEEAYNVDVRSLQRKGNELTLDTAIRNGYLPQLWEYVNIQ